MLLFALWLQVSVVDSTYSSAALKTLVNEAAARNRNMPASVRRYSADVETEIAINIRQSAGVEAPVSLEQLQSSATWSRPGEFEQHVIGDRLQAVGPQLTALTFLRQSLLVPHLYGNRIQLLFGQDSGLRRVDRARPGREVSAVHPLSDVRERVYRFSGGDTVLTMRADARAIPLVRVGVTPRVDVPPRTIVFTGEILLDVTRAQLVKMRGRFFSVGDGRGLLGKAIGAGIEGAVYVELENAEIDGQVWLPATQRFEAQILFRISSDTRSIFRSVSTFRRHHVGFDSTSVTSTADTLETRVHRLTLASGDSLGRFSGWMKTLGDATAGTQAEDFDDVAPDAWKSIGNPRFDFRASRLAELIHINRVEGWYLGAAGEFRARDLSPGLVIHASAGWAWQQQMGRGRISASWTRGHNGFDIHAGRALDITNDFRAPLDSGSTLGALFGTDDYDYVQRNLIGASWGRYWGREQSVVTGVEIARVRDGAAERHMARSPLGLGAAYRENRGVTGGTFTRSIVSLTMNPRVAVGFIQPGAGGQVVLQRGDGDLQYQRVEARGVIRWHRDHLTMAVRTDLGALTGHRIPAQQLFEIGAGQNLLGYDYKEFVGNQGLVVRGLVMRSIPVLLAPIRMSRFLLPAPAPAFSASLQSAWIGLGGDNAAQAVSELIPSLRPAQLLGYCDAPAPTPVTGRPSCSWRTSVGIGVRLFGGAIGIDLARPVDHGDRWRVQLGIGQIL